MLKDIGGPELLIILVIVILVFGVGRISKIFGELGSGLRSFQKGLKGDEGVVDEEKDAAKSEDVIDPNSSK